MHPDIIVEHVCGLYLFSGETPEGREWLKSRGESPQLERIGRAVGVNDERQARDLTAAAIADGLDVME